jgi:hypothetical protein
MEWMTLLTLPTLLLLSRCLFCFSAVARGAVAALYAVGMYALLLTENIYNVTADRTITARAAQSIGFLRRSRIFYSCRPCLHFGFPAAWSSSDRCDKFSSLIASLWS